MRKIAVVVLLLVAVSLLAAPKKSARPVPVAPDKMAHPMALFLASLSKDGTKEVRFKATAVGHRFFFEEPTGVTVYIWEDGGYRKEEFLKASTLPKAVKRYANPGLGTR